MRCDLNHPSDTEAGRVYTLHAACWRELGRPTVGRYRSLIKCVAAARAERVND